MHLKMSTALLIAFAPVFSAQAASFTNNGETYTYSTQRQADGAVRLVGSAAHSHAPFELTVRKRHVMGTMNGTPVDFEVSRDTAARFASEVDGSVQTAALGQ